MPSSETAQALDATIAAVGQKMTYGGAAGTFVGFLLSSEGAALVGIVGVIGGLVIQFYFKRRQDKREQEEHAAKMAMYRD